ncbi:MAG: YiiX/YebB-like N1pC/P60 family cysteine hydrolase, partial [candidate division WOR-3 bacterium]
GLPEIVLIFRVLNGDSTNSGYLTHVSVYLNDEEILSENELNQSNGLVEKSVTLTQEENILWVKLWDDPPGWITISFLIEVADRNFTIPGDNYELPPDTVPVPEEYWKFPKENDIPFSEFKAIPRYIPTEKEVREYFEQYPTGEGTNSCPFNNNQRGDILLTHDGWIWCGWHRHSGIWTGYGGARGTVHSHGDDGGVCYKIVDYWWNSYDFCRVMRVITWPISTNLRSSATDYCEEQIGKPYNYNWLWKWTQSSFYCSQLNWAGYYWKSPWYCRIDIDICCHLGDCHVSPDEIFANWRTYTIASGW